LSIVIQSNPDVQNIDFNWYSATLGGYDQFPIFGFPKAVENILQDRKIDEFLSGAAAL